MFWIPTYVRKLRTYPGPVSQPVCSLLLRFLTFVGVELVFGCFGAENVVTFFLAL